MAYEGVDVTPGSGKTIATDRVGTLDIQVVKLDGGSDGNSTPIVAGQQTASASIPVVLASDQPAIPNPSASSATITSVAGSGSSTTLKASNSARKGLIIFNDSSAALYIKFGATASTSSFSIKLFPYETYAMDTVIYTGIIDGIWDSATGNARVTEL